MLLTLQAPPPPAQVAAGQPRTPGRELTAEELAENGAPPGSVWGPATIIAPPPREAEQPPPQIQVRVRRYLQAAHGCASYSAASGRRVGRSKRVMWARGVPLHSVG
jgi:hypothetical protein